MRTSLTHEKKRQQRSHESQQVTTVGIGTNLGLVLLKLLAGFLGHSAALIADAIHSISDIVTDVFVLLGLHWSSRPSDRGHPYGHGKIETLTTLFVGIAVIAAALRIGYGGIAALSDPPRAPSWLALLAAAISIVAKEILFRYTRATGLRLESKILIANAWHHRSDAISSIVAIVGVAGSMAGIRLLDPLAATIVAALVAYVGAKIVLGALPELAEASVDKELLEAIAATAQDVPGIVDVHGLRARHVGPVVSAQLHVRISPDSTVRESHALAHQVEAKIIDTLKEVEDVLVHVEPTDTRGSRQPPAAGDSPRTED